MDVLHPRCAGLDVHQKAVVACARLASPGAVTHEVRTFGTTTKGLLALADWLRRPGSPTWQWSPRACTGSRSGTCWTGSSSWCWPTRRTSATSRPQDRCQRCHLDRRSPGARPDPRQLRPARCGPGASRSDANPQTARARDRAAHVLRIQKTLEDANIKIVGVISDILGASGRAILEAIIAGEQDPGEACRPGARSAEGGAASTSSRRCAGGCSEHHRFMLKLHLEQIDRLRRRSPRSKGGWASASSPFATPSSC